MQKQNTEGVKAWITSFMFGMVLICDRTDLLPFGKELASMIFENVAIRYDEILTRGLTNLILNLRK